MATETPTPTSPDNLDLPSQRAADVVELAKGRLLELEQLSLSDETTLIGLLSELCSLVRRVGIRELATPEVRALAQVAQSRIQASDVSSVTTRLAEFVLARLVRGRIAVPHYRDYAPSRLLVARGTSAEATVRAAAMAVADLVDTVATFPEIRHHAKYKAFVECVDIMADACRKLGFGSGPAVPVAPPLAPALAILPESPHTAEECAFIAAVLTTDIIFEALSAVVTGVNARIACSEMGYAAAELYHAVKLAKNTTQGFRLLLVMSVELWLEIRPFVELPSALQSQAYEHLRSGIIEMQRRRHHIRWDAAEEALFSGPLDRAIAELAGAVDAWSHAHVRGATAYTPHEGAYPQTLDYIVDSRPLNEGSADEAA